MGQLNQGHFMAIESLVTWNCIMVSQLVMCCCRWWPTSCMEYILIFLAAAPVVVLQTNKMVSTLSNCKTNDTIGVRTFQWGKQEEIHSFQASVCTMLLCLREVDRSSEDWIILFPKVMWKEVVKIELFCFQKWIGDIRTDQEGKLQQLR